MVNIRYGSFIGIHISSTGAVPKLKEGNTITFKIHPLQIGKELENNVLCMCNFKMCVCVRESMCERESTRAWENVQRVSVCEQVS